MLLKNILYKRRKFFKKKDLLTVLRFHFCFVKDADMHKKLILYKFYDSIVYCLFCAYSSPGAAPQSKSTSTIGLCLCRGHPCLCLCLCVVSRENWSAASSSDAAERAGTGRAASGVDVSWDEHSDPWSACRLLRCHTISQHQLLFKTFVLPKKEVNHILNSRFKEKNQSLFKKIFFFKFIPETDKYLE